MAKEEAFELEGVVKEVHPSTNFTVELDNGHTVAARLGGRLRKHNIRILLGDRVTVEVSPYDMTKGRITFRHG